KRWLAADPAAPAAKPGDESADTPHSKPQKLHVIGDVMAKSPELEILSPRGKATDLLIVYFADVPALPTATVASPTPSSARPTNIPPSLTPPAPSVGPPPAALPAVAPPPPP